MLGEMKERKIFEHADLAKALGLLEAGVGCNREMAEEIVSVLPEKSPLRQAIEEHLNNNSRKNVGNQSQK